MRAIVRGILGVGGSVRGGEFLGYPAIGNRFGIGGGIAFVMTETIKSTTSSQIRAAVTFELYEYVANDLA